MRANASKSGALSTAAAVLIRGSGIVSILFLGTCADVPTGPEARADYDRANDPAEPTNRAIFAGNQFVDRTALQPVARAYDDYTALRSMEAQRRANFVEEGKAGEQPGRVNIGPPVTDVTLMPDTP
jgi:ABC-type transporter lipoprotein component MlaA